MYIISITVLKYLLCFFLCFFKSGFSLLIQCSYLKSYQAFNTGFNFPFFALYLLGCLVFAVFDLLNFHYPQRSQKDCFTNGWIMSLILKTYSYPRVIQKKPKTNKWDLIRLKGSEQ